MIASQHGNLLTADAEALVNAVNTVGVMGKGIALQFKRAYPANYAAYRAACAADDLRVGRVFVFDTGLVGPRRYIINFPTKGHWRSGSRLADIGDGLDNLVRIVRERRIGSLVVPALGCGNGGARLERGPSVDRAGLCRAAQRPGVALPPEGPPDPAHLPIATERPPLTPGRATLLPNHERH